MKEQFVLPATDRERSVERLTQFLLYCLPGKPLRVRVGVYRRERSLDQNAALWGVAYKVLSDETGHDADDLHTYFCAEFFGHTEVEILGGAIRRPLRTTTRDEHGNRDVLKTDQFCEFYAFIQRRAAEATGIYIPDPDPEYLKDAKNQS